MEVIKINNEIIDADVEMIKVRLLSIVDNKLIVANYANNYMLPGGKVDAGESLIDALIREIKEETGEELLKTELRKLVTVDDYEEHSVNISVVDGIHNVEAKWLLQVLKSINFDDYESLNYFQKVLVQSGVIDALKEKGIQEGDTVSIYDIEFDFVE